MATISPPESWTPWTIDPNWQAKLAATPPLAGLEAELDELHSQIAQIERRQNIEFLLNKCVIEDYDIEAGMRELAPGGPSEKGEYWEMHEHDGTYTVLLHLRKKEVSS